MCMRWADSLPKPERNGIVVLAAIFTDLINPEPPYHSCTCIVGGGGAVCGRPLEFGRVVRPLKGLAGQERGVGL